MMLAPIYAIVGRVLPLVLASISLAHDQRAGAQTVRRVPGQYASIQAAIDAAQSLDRIEVGPGRYVENVDFRGKEVAVVSTHGPRRTIIDGGGQRAVVLIATGEGARTRLVGFTITGGTSGGVVCRNSFPHVVGNVITRNRSTNGAGVSIIGSGAVVRNNDIIDNIATGAGGGVFVDGQSAAITPIVEGNRIHRNIADEGGGCVVHEGSVFNNWIYENRASEGGGILVHDIGLVAGNTIVDNYATRQFGGAGAMNPAQAAIVNCIVAGNIAPASAELPSAQISGLTLSHNATPRGLSHGRNNIALAPEFVDAASHDFHLRVDSALRDRGDASFAFTRDFDGGPRVVGAGIDIGADEIDDALYVAPGTIDGRPPTLRVIGRPGDTVYWTTSAGLLPAPIALPPFGQWHLQSPIGPIRTIPPLPSSGFARVDLTLSPAQIGLPLAVQALLLRPTGGRLTNAAVLADTQPFVVRRVPAQHATIQAAIDAAGNDERIEVAPGTYRETIDFRGKAVYLVATGGPTVTTIDANWTREVVRIQRAEPGVATLDGFTITKGWGGIAVGGRPTIVRNRIVNNGNTGIECGPGTNPIIRDNFIANNDSNYGGGILARGRALVTGNEITTNTSSYGGGIHLREQPMVLRNKIHGNHSRVLGGGAYVVEQPALIQNLWYRNTAQQAAGAIYFAEGTVLGVSNTITGNTTSTLQASVVFDRVKLNSALVDGIIWPDRTQTRLSAVRLDGNTTVDPLFVDASADDYHLTHQSPAVGMARATPNGIATDFEGDARPVGSSEDSGADQRSPHLYHTSVATPGQSVQLKVIGAPGVGVSIAFSAGVLPLPVKLSGLGYLRLAGPIGTLANGVIGPNGVLRLSIPIPAGFPRRSIPMQALIGSTLSNLDVIDVR